MVYIIGSKKNENKESFLHTKISRREFMKYAGLGALGLYASCKSPTTPEPPEPPKPKKYDMSGKVTNLYDDNDMIRNYKISMKGPETRTHDSTDGSYRFDQILEGKYKITIEGPEHYSPRITYRELYSNMQYDFDVVKNGSIDTVFLEDILLRPTERWETTPRFDIYRKTSYNGNTYEFNDNDINELKKMIQNDVPPMARGKMFWMDVPQIEVKEETFTNPGCPYIENVILTFPDWGTSQARAPTRDGVLWAGKWPVRPLSLYEKRGAVLHELLHCFGYGDVKSERVPTIMFWTMYSPYSSELPSEHDLKISYKLNSRLPFTKAPDEEPNTIGWSAMQYYDMGRTDSRDSLFNFDIPIIGREKEFERRHEIEKRREEERIRRRQ